MLVDMREKPPKVEEFKELPVPDSVIEDPAMKQPNGKAPRSRTKSER